MKKVLLVASVLSHVAQFHRPLADEDCHPHLTNFCPQRLG